MALSAELGSRLHVVIVMPVRDDWTSAAELVRRLDRALQSFPCVLDFLLVDDCSVERCNPDDFQFNYTASRSLQVLRLRRNLGHQRAIAIGLVRIYQAMAPEAVIVMDADGEDTPEGVLELVQAFSKDSTKVIFAERSRRTESFVFRSFYALYKLLHRILTGFSVRVGNFSILPASCLETLVVTSELWNHYAAAVFRSGFLRTMIPIPRGHRIAGTSRMNFVSLTAHGMSAISVFGDIVGVRLLMAALTGAGLAAMGVLAVIGTRLFTNQGIPGWATNTVGLLLVILFQLVTIAASFTFTILSSRINLSFVPLRDYELFVASTRTIYPNA
jgi:polyisoprenyl-phosphate glycosyltransferase